MRPPEDLLPEPLGLPTVPGFGPHFAPVVFVADVLPGLRPRLRPLLDPGFGPLFAPLVEVVPAD